jgi:hypothetical protein
LAYQFKVSSTELGVSLGCYHCAQCCTTGLCFVGGKTSSKLGCMSAPDVTTDSRCPFGFVGLLLLTFFLYGVSLFYHGLPPSPFNPAWHLAARCYASFLFERNEFFASIQGGGR